VVGWFTFLPFAISPRLWVAWHNRVHHGNANRAGIDPDAYPTLKEYHASGTLRATTDWFAIGRSRLRGLTGLLVGFSVQSLHMLLVAGKRRYLSAAQHRLALLETGLGVSVWVALFFVLGPLDFLVACALPLVVANVIVMGHIFTNHSLSPLTHVNDPLANSLSVTVPFWVDWLTLRFGFHVEHHLFPWMSSRHAVEVRGLIVERWPERYQSMPLWRALLRVHHTPRVYEEFTTLLDPGTGRRAPTLGAPPVV
jgi:fatty acid desaturase